MLGEISRRLARAFAALTEPSVTDVDPPVSQVAEAATPWADEDLTDCRAASALSLLDEDVVGYLLLTFHGDAETNFVSAHLSHVVGRGWWPLVERVVQEVVAKNADL